MVEVNTPDGNVDLEDVSAWLMLLHGASEGFVHICSVGNWTGRTFPVNDVDAAVDYVQHLDAHGAQGIYMRVTTLKAPLPAGSRGADGDSRSFPALWADIDIAGPGHKTKKPLPTTVEDAMRIVSESGLPEPTLWIHSGGGLYPYWLLSNPVDVTNSGHLDATANLSARWQAVLAATAERIGFSYGPVGDLSRVMRIPGTINRKVPESPRRCQFLTASSGNRLYQPEELGNGLQAAEQRVSELAPPAPAAPRSPVPQRSGDAVGERPGDILAGQLSWEEILEPHGYQFDRTHGAETYWVRPGKSRRDGHSCTTNYANSGLLYVFSTEMEGFEAGSTYSKFAAWAVLNGFGSNFAAAARALRAEGYRSERQASPPPRPFQPRQVADGGGSEGVEEVHGQALPDVDVTNSAHALTKVREVINSGLIPCLYVKDGQLVEVARVSGHFDETDDFKPIGINPVTADALVRILSEHANVFKMVKSGKGDDAEWNEVPTAIAGTTARAVLSCLTWDGVPVLRDIVEAPVLRADGSLLQDPGYDVASKLYLHPRVQVERVPDQPSDELVTEARDFLLDKVLGDFPWSSQADLTNYVALLMTPILRPYVGGLVPLGAVSATERGSGKTLLTDIIGQLYGSVSRPWVPGDEELRKSITTILMGEAAPVVVFDNVGDGERVEAATLAKLLTSRKWDDRALGTNKGFSGLNDRMWMVTGNNVALGGDIASRTVLVSIDPKMPRPDLRRNFQLGDLEEWLYEPENRAKLLRYLLVLARAWIAAEAPRADVTMRGFSHWAKALGGLVAFHNLNAFMGNEAEVQNLDAESDEWTAFFAAWHERYGDRPQTAAGLVTESKNLMFNDPWREALPADTSQGLGMLLKARRGRHFNGFVLLGGRDERRKVWEWRVITAAQEAVEKFSALEGP